MSKEKKPERGCARRGITRVEEANRKRRGFPPYEDGPSPPGLRIRYPSRWCPFNRWNGKASEKGSNLPCEKGFNEKRILLSSEEGNLYVATGCLRNRQNV